MKDPRVPAPYRRRPETETFGCALLAGLVVGIAFGLAVGLIIGYGYAASRPGQDTPTTLRDSGHVSMSEAAAPGRTGAPERTGQPRKAAPPSTRPPREAARGESHPVSRAAPSPDHIGTAATAGPGKWYATGGPGLHGAMRWWHWGMAPVAAKVCGDQGCVEIVVNDHMVSTTTLIDLSPAAFGIVCGQLSRGVCTVTVER